MNDTDELRAAAQQALVALVHHTEQTRPIQRTADAIEALRAALAQPAAPDRWNEGFKHGQWLAKHSAPVVERADSATPVVERDAGNLSDNAAPVAHARWYCVTNYGGATLCTSRADAAEVAAEQDIAIPRHGPHRAVMMAEVLPARVPLTDERLNAAGLDYALADSFSGKAEWVAQDIADAFKAGARAAERYYAATPAQGEPK